MFRYGGPSWQGTGITTGLDTPPRIDLAQGGRTIGGGTIHGTPMGNRTGFDTPYVEGYNRIFGNPTRTPLNITKIAEVGSTGGSTAASTTGSTAARTYPRISERGLVELLKKARNLPGPLFNFFKSRLALTVSAGLPLAAYEELTRWLQNALEEAGMEEGALSAGFPDPMAAGARELSIPGIDDSVSISDPPITEAERTEAFLGRVERQETIPPIPPEAVTGLDIEGVLKETNGEIKGTDIAETKILEEDRDNALKLIKDQEKNAPGSSLSEKEKALALEGGQVPLFDRIYGAQEADIKRNAWLMLAKFGARLMEKPVGEAAEESLTDFEKIAKEKRDLRAITTMKEAEWEHQKELTLMKNIATDKLTKPQQKIEQLTDIFQAPPHNMDYTKAKTQAKHIAAMHGSSETQALVKTAEGAYRLNEANNPGAPITQVYDRFGWAMLLDKNLGTENMIRLPLTTKKIKKIVDGKTKREKEERFDFKKLPGGMIIPDRFYFIDDPTSQTVGWIYQYTGEGAIRDWGQLLSATNEGTWKVYYK